MACTALAALVAFPSGASEPGWVRLNRPITLPTGQRVDPAGRLVPLLAYPTGAAFSPDGSRILVIAGRAIQTGELPAGPNVTLRLLDAATGAVLQTLGVGDAFQSVAYSPNGAFAYVAGGSDNSVHGYSVAAAGALQALPDLAVPGCQFASGLAVAPDGSALWVACALSGTVAELALPSGRVLRQVAVANPDQVALSPHGSTAYVTDWRGHAVYAISAASGAVASYQVGAEPEGLAVLPDGRVAVADSNDATLATIDPATASVQLTSLGIVAAGRRSDAPDGVAVGPGGRLYVSLGAENAVAVLVPRAGGWRLAGLLPTAWDPTAVVRGPGDALAVVSGLGLGHSAAATAPYLSPDPVALAPDGAYATVGSLQLLRAPAGQALAAQTRFVRGATAAWRPAGRLPAALAAGSPIHHVIYITRENKTYDSELGDLRPGPGAALAVFGRSVTPNLHLLASTYVDARRFYQPAFQSSIGHMWEDAGGVNDVFLRSVSDPALDSHWSDPTNYPATGLLTEQAWRAGLSVRAYDEELAQRFGLLPYAYQASPAVYPNYNLSIPDTTREAGWASEFRQFAAGDCTGALAATYGSRCTLPALEYVYLGGDHTTVVDQPGSPTIEAQVANDDYATAELIQTVSHSRFWRSTLIVITEDDPQGTGDRLSAYRGIVALAGPYVRRGAVSVARYQWTSVVAGIDRILGLPPLTDAVAQAPPLETLFTNHPSFRPFIASTLGVTAYPWVPLPNAPVRIPVP